jgi:hypothetical protein
MSFEFSEAWGMHCFITLLSGRSIDLYRLNQSKIYAGMLEGLPMASTNNTLIEARLKDAQVLSPDHAPHLLEPSRRNYDRIAGDCDTYTAALGYSAEFLPNVVCVGCFSSWEPARDKSKDFSGLTVVWFQNEYGLPSDPHTLERLRSIDWEKLAWDGDY